MSDAEKLVESGMKYPVEPLILRPPVGGEMLRNARVEWSREGCCNSRRLILRLMLACILLALAAGAVLVIFALHRDTWPWHPMGRHAARSGRCGIITPFPEFNMRESYLFEPKAITIRHGPVAGYPPVSVFHLLNDAMTVMRTSGTCYIYPISPEVAEAVPTDESMLARIQEADEGFGEMRTTIEPRMYMIAPASEGRFNINHPAAAANCSDVPIFRLVEMVLSQASLQTNQDAPMEQSLATGCPVECPAGESRDLPGDRVRQVCRCAPRDDLPLPPIIPPQKEEVPSNLRQEVVKREGEEVLPEASDAALDEDDDDDDMDDDLDDDFEDDEDDGDLDDLATFDDFGRAIANAGAWIPEEGGQLVRSRRSAGVDEAMTPSIKVPSSCTPVENVLEGAIPGGYKHHLPIMQIVKC